VPARVEGWKAPAFVARHGTTEPSRMSGAASPFDSLSGNASAPSACSLSVSARDLHARRAARTRVLRAAVAARRSARRARRSESRSPALRIERDQPAPRAARSGHGRGRTITGRARARHVARSRARGPVATQGVRQLLA
jgi:hypothetical protein